MHNALQESIEVDSGIGSESDHEHTQQSQSPVTQSPHTEQEQEQEQVQAQQQYVEAQGMAVHPQPLQHQGSVAAGPRPAPTCRVVSAIKEKKEDGPGSRCGHTLTAVEAVGEEGTPGYIGPRLILFGGATALEGNSAATGPPSSGGNAGISFHRLALLFLAIHDTRDILLESEDEREMYARTIYCTNIDKKVSQADMKLFFESLCGEVSRLILLGDYHHSTRIAFVEFVMVKRQSQNNLRQKRLMGAYQGLMGNLKTMTIDKRPGKSINQA